MKTSPAGIALIKRFEGFEPVAYLDVAGVPTIGYGHTRTVTSADVEAGNKISLFEAGMLLKEDLISAEEDVMRLVRVPLSQSQFDALVSFVFNLGGAALAGSTLLKELNAGRYLSVPLELARWVYARNSKTGQKEVFNGLVARRAAEAEMFSQAHAVSTGGAVNPEPVKIRTERESLATSRTSWGTSISMAGTATSAASTALTATTPLQERVGWLPDVLAALIVAGLLAAFIGAAWALYARRDDHKRAMR